MNVLPYIIPLSSDLSCALPVASFWLLMRQVREQEHDKSYRRRFSPFGGNGGPDNVCVFCILPILSSLAPLVFACFFSCLTTSMTLFVSSAPSWRGFFIRASSWLFRREIEKDPSPPSKNAQSLQQNAFPLLVLLPFFLIRPAVSFSAPKPLFL